MECLENYDYMYLIGDLNQPEIDSTSFDLDDGSSKAKIIGHLMSHYDLFSINNIRNINNITLDLVLTNMVDATVDVSGLSLTDISDKNHPPLDITFSFKNSHIEGALETAILAGADEVEQVILHKIFDGTAPDGAAQNPFDLYNMVASYVKTYSRFERDDINRLAGALQIPSG
ncbi:hypothetical protein JTB14_023115 [Gonioctena quinquepunctata]|nr:hypothetical protein JTB14_023115 [Gonioctena quinquepunctata]